MFRKLLGQSRSNKMSCLTYVGRFLLLQQFHKHFAGNLDPTENKKSPVELLTFSEKSDIIPWLRGGKDNDPILNNNSLRPGRHRGHVAEDQPDRQSARYQHA